MHLEIEELENTVMTTATNLLEPVTEAPSVVEQPATPTSDAITPAAGERPDIQAPDPVVETAPVLSVEEPPSESSSAELAFGERAFTLRELKGANIPVPSELVENMFLQGEIVGLVGRPKTGKSRLAQQLAIAVASGTEFLGHKTLKTPVLYLDFENPPALAQKRFCEIAGPHFEKVQDSIAIHCVRNMIESAVGLTGEPFKKLARMVEETQAGLVIFDTWRFVFAGKSENDAQATHKNLRSLRALQKANPNLVILLVHHLRKDDNSGQSTFSLKDDPQRWLDNTSGSQAFTGFIDAAYGFERQGGTEDELYVFGGIRRSGEPPLIILQSDVETLRFENPKDVKQVTAYALSVTENLLWMNLPGQFRWADALKVAGGDKKKSLLSRTLKRAQENSLLRRDGGGRYVKAT